MTAQDFNNLWEEKGPMDADRRNVANISGMWNIDYYHGKNFFMKQVVNGWTISPVWVMQSGSPFSVTTGSDKNDDSANANRPDLVSGNETRSSIPTAAAGGCRGMVQHSSVRCQWTGRGRRHWARRRRRQRTARLHLRNPGYRDVDLGHLPRHSLCRGHDLPAPRRSHQRL